MTRKQVKFDVNPLFNGPSMEARARSGSPFRILPLADIDVDPEQPRRLFENESLNELAASIKQFGVICPVLVKLTEGGTYRLVSGERRVRACRLLGLETIPAVVDDEQAGEPNSLAKQLVENLQREDLSSMERALGIGQLQERYSLSVREIARLLGVSKSFAQRSLEVLSLPDDLQAALIAGAAESKVLLLAQLKKPASRKKLLEQLDNLTRAQLESAVAELNGRGKKTDKLSHGGTAERAKKEKTPLSAEDQHVVDEIKRALGTKVELQRSQGKPKQGKLVIEFYSDEDLDEIFQRLTGWEDAV